MSLASTTPPPLGSIAELTGRLAPALLLRQGKKMLDMYGVLINQYRGFIPAGVVAVRIFIESSGDPRCGYAKPGDSYLDEVGLLQVSRFTRAEQGYPGKEGRDAIIDPATNIKAGCAHWAKEVGQMVRAIPVLGNPVGANADFWKVASMYTAVGSGGTEELIRRARRGGYAVATGSVYQAILDYTVQAYLSGTLQKEWQRAADKVTGTTTARWLGGLIRRNEKGERVSVKPEKLVHRVRAMAPMADAGFVLDTNGGYVPAPGFDKLYAAMQRDPELARKLVETTDPKGVLTILDKINMKDLVGAITKADNGGKAAIAKAYYDQVRNTARGFQMQGQSRKNHNDNGAVAMAAGANTLTIARASKEQTAGLFNAASVKGATGAVMYNDKTGLWSDGKMI